MYYKAFMGLDSEKEKHKYNLGLCISSIKHEHQHDARIASGAVVVDLTLSA